MLTNFRSYLLVVAVGLGICVLDVTMDAQLVPFTPVPTKIYTGSDIGFKVTGRKGETPVGTIVIKINDKWVEVESTTAMKMAAQRN